MYTDYFRLRELPFTLTPDTRFFMGLPSHQEALNLILVALHSGDGFIKVVGEVGTGKTLLCRKVLNTLDTNAYVTVYLPNSYLKPDEFRRNVACELGIYVEGKADDDLLQAITDRLIDHAHKGQRVVLLVDEVQSMPEETIEALRLLTNLETESQKLFQVVLFGQPELDQVLNRQSLRQLKQRIIYSCWLQTLSPDEVEFYIMQRMYAAGCQSAALFDHKACDLIARTSKGVPRLVNILSHKALLVAYGKGDYRVSVQHAMRAVKDTESVRIPFLFRIKALLPVMAVLAVAALVAGSLIRPGALL
ncbi:MAG: ExeA family protein [Pontibacterium sp.]